MIDGFLVKKLVSVVFHLIPGMLLLLLMSLLLRRWLPRLSFFFSVLLCLLLIAASMPQVSNYFVAKLEDQYPVLQVIPADTALILVLGFGQTYTEDRPVNSVLSPVALSRLVEAVRLWKTRPEVTLVVSGASPGTFSHAELMQNMAIELGVPSEKILRFDKTVDTEAEIKLAVQALKKTSADPTSESVEKSVNNRLVVVSSATHLPRAVLLLEHHEVLYSLAPTDFLVSTTRWLPSVFSLLSLDRAFHEWLGMAWYRLKLAL